MADGPDQFPLTPAPVYPDDVRSRIAGIEAVLTRQADMLSALLDVVLPLLGIRAHDPRRVIALAAQVKADRQRLAAAVHAAEMIVRTPQPVSENAPMSKEMDDLEAQVKQMSTVSKSAVTLIGGLADRLSAAKNDPAKVQALADELRQDAQDLASAITANTPADTSGDATGGTAGGSTGGTPPSP